MPTLAQILDSANRASYYSRDPSEVLAAADRAQQRLYLSTVKELRGAFVKTDSTTLTAAWAANQDTYALPADFAKMIQLAERTDPTQAWRPMPPLDVNNPAFVEDQFDYGGPGAGGPYSEFSYWGPWLDGVAAATGQETWKIKVAPMPQDPPAGRTLQLIYQAQYAPIATKDSKLMLPAEATYALRDYAIAELLRLNSDQLAAQYEATGQELETRYLAWLRQRQVQQVPIQQPYLDDLD